jgi:hypothetical protein
MKLLSKVFGSPACGEVRPSGFGPHFGETLLTPFASGRILLLGSV